MGSGSSSPGSPSMNAKEWLEQMENNFTGDASNFNPGSFDDLHQKPLSVFPKPFSGLKLAFLNKFCNHSQLFSSLVLGGAGTGANSCNFDYRWTGDKNVRPVLSPHFFEIPNLTAETTNCKHGTFMGPISNFRGSVDGDALEYLPTCLALNVRKFLTEYTGPNYTIGFAARDVLLGDKNALADYFPDALWERNHTEAEIQGLLKITPGIDVGLQVRRIIDNDVKLIDYDSLWSWGIGARLHVLDGVIISGTFSKGEADLWGRVRLSDDFQLAAGYSFNSGYPETGFARVACKFTDSKGLVVKLGADTRGQIVASLAKNLSSVSLPMTLILVGKCDANTAFPKYEFGVGAEIS